MDDGRLLVPIVIGNREIRQPLRANDERESVISLFLPNDLDVILSARQPNGEVSIVIIEMAGGLRAIGFVNIDRRSVR